MIERMDDVIQTERKAKRAIKSLFVAWLVVMAIFFSLRWYVEATIDDALSEMPSIEASQSFKETLAIGNHTFDLYADFRSESGGIFEGAQINATLMIDPTNFEPAENYSFEATFLESHPSKEDYYIIFFEDNCYFKYHQVDYNSSELKDFYPFFCESTM